jgi:hypothetical protein
MARIKNTSFVGAAPRTVVADASITQGWLANAVGDTALVSDKCTGENGETPITHTGAGDGCPLRLPLAAQHLDRSLTLVGTTVAEDDFYILAVPVFVPTGEGGQYRLTVDVSPYRSDAVTAEVLSSAGTVDWGPYPGSREAVAGVVVASEVAAVGVGSRLGESVRWSVTLGVGTSYILVKRLCYFGDTDPNATLFSWSLDHDRTYAGDANGLSAGHGGTAITDPYKTNASTFTPSTDHDTYDEEVTVNGPLSAYVLTRLNRQLNALWERITGALIPGNFDYQTTTTWDNNRSSFTAEGLLDFPMTIVALGACNADSSKPSVGDYTDLTPSDGLIDWTMHPTTRTMSWGFLTTLAVQCPSFSASSSTLKAKVLINVGSGKTSANWRFRGNSAAGASSDVAAVQIGSSNFFVASITAIPFTASADNLLSIEISNTATTAGLGTEEIDVLGVVLYYEP